jgi:hypothetical protein
MPATAFASNPGAEGYGDIAKVGAADLLTPQLVPELVLRLADLDMR